MPYFKPQVLLGPLHVAAARGEPDNPARGHLVLQRRPEHAMDRLQLSFRHDFPHRHRRQLQDWQVTVRLIGLSS